MKKYIIPIIIALIAASVFGAYRKGFVNGKKKAVETIIVQRDTIYQFDTITHLKPVYLTERVIDTVAIYVHVTDTISVLAYLPRTERTYKDTAYFCRISGVEPVLEEIKVYQKSGYIHDVTYLPIEDTRKDWIELDARFIYDKMPLAPITLNFGRKLGYLDVYAGGGYDIFQKSFVGQVGGRLQFRY